MPVDCNPSLAGRKICHTTDGFNTQDKTPIGQQVSYPDRVIPLGMAGGVKPRSIRNEPDSRNPAFDRNGNTGDFDNKGWMDVDANATALAKPIAIPEPSAACRRKVQRTIQRLSTPTKTTIRASIRNPRERDQMIFARKAIRSKRSHRSNSRTLEFNNQKQPLKTLFKAAMRFNHHSLLQTSLTNR